MLTKISNIKKRLKKMPFFVGDKDRSQKMLHLLAAPILGFPVGDDEENLRFHHESGQDAWCQEFMEELHHTARMHVLGNRIQSLYDLCAACLIHSTSPHRKTASIRAGLEKLPEILKEEASTFVVSHNDHVRELFYVLMRTLSKSIPCPEERRRHILSSSIMLVLRNEDENNLLVWRLVFRLMGGDASMCKHACDHQNDPAADVVVVEGDAEVCNGSMGRLRRRGFLIAVIPRLWRSPPAGDEMKGVWKWATRSMTPVWVEMTAHGVDLCVLKREKNQGETATKILGIDGRLYERNLLEYKFLFGGDLDFFDKILSSSEDEERVRLARFSTTSPSEHSLNVAQLRDMCRQQKIRGYSRKSKSELLELFPNHRPCRITMRRSQDTPYPLVQSMFKDGRIKKRMWCQSPLPSLGFGKHKVFVGKTGCFSKCWYDGGDMGGTEDVPAIMVENVQEGLDIVGFFKRTTISEKLKKYANWSSGSINMLHHLRKDFYLA